MEDQKALNEKELEKVVGGDAVHFNSLAEQCYSEMCNYLEQNRSAQAYCDMLNLKIQEALDLGCVTVNEAQELMDLVNHYSRRLRAE